MAKPYKRCIFIADGQQCDKWFDVKEPFPYCSVHRALPSTSIHADQSQIGLYIDNANGQRNLCADMNIIQLDEHIRGLERQRDEFFATVIQDLKHARAVRTEKINQLTEDQRKELREQRYHVQANLDYERRHHKAKPKPRISKEKKHKVPEVFTKDMLEMDPEEFLAKFQKAKEHGPDNTQ
jgi:hypothetical protein